MRSASGIDRRGLLRLLIATTLNGVRSFPAQNRIVQTVTGPVPAAQLGPTLVHEHIVTDLRAPRNRRSGEYDREDAIRVARPYLRDLHRTGCRTLVEPTPIFIGRDLVALRRLSEMTGLSIVAATGIYGAADQQFIPEYARTESAGRLAERYIREIREGAGTSGVQPGIIKTGVNPETPLPEIERKLVRAALLAHKATGLTVASHTGFGAPALEQLRMLERLDVPPSSFIWVHAQREKDHSLHYQAARSGAWVEFDGIGPRSIDWHLDCVAAMAQAGLLQRTLISQDAGWYRPGEPDGGAYRGYTFLFTDFLPRLRERGFSAAEVTQLLVTNPANALTDSAN